MTIVCLYCGNESEAVRATKKFCSDRCANRHREGRPSSRSCKTCGEVFPIVDRSDANRKYCSRKCAKRGYYKNIKGWQKENPEELRRYSKEWRDRNPSFHKDDNQDRRQKILDFLGGKCVVCGVSNRYWLHVDYIPTTRGAKHRHPRHFNYIKDHKEDFRILCANHHYELTLTGRIEGTEIVQ